MSQRNAKEIEQIFSYKQLLAYNSKLRSDLNALKFENNLLRIQQENSIKKEV